MHSTMQIPWCSLQINSFRVFFLLLFSFISKTMLYLTLDRTKESSKRYIVFYMYKLWLKSRLNGFSFLLFAHLLELIQTKRLIFVYLKFYFEREKNCKKNWNVQKVSEWRSISYFLCDIQMIIPFTFIIA